MNNIGKKLEIFVIVVIIAAIGIIYAFKKPNSTLLSTNLQTPSQQNTQVTPNTGTSVRSGNNEVPPPTQQVPTSTIEYKGVDGKNALELLQTSHRVDVKHYSFGDLVTGIDGIQPDSSHFWAMYVNGNFSQVGASSYVTKSSDTIKWEIDAVVDTKK